MPSWIEPQELEPTDELSFAVGGHPLVTQALMRRGLRDVAAALAFFDPNRYTPSDPIELPGLPQAADRVMQAIHNQETILVWGDFDVDGQTATTLLVSALRSLNARVTYHIPVRHAESHGVNVEVLSRALDQDASIRLVLTCDTGISAHQAVNLALSRGVDMVITDHHTLPVSLPQAAGIVNPRFLPLLHPLSTLPGVGVAYMLAQELHRRSGDAQVCEDYLDLVALGIVADLADLHGDVRYLLQRGLQVLRGTKRQGLKVMMELADLENTWLTEEHIGYLLAPRLNAIGRLGDANPVVDLLTTLDEGKVRLIAEQIEGLNARRQMLTSQVLRAALTQIDQSPRLLDDPVLVLSHPTWPAGVIGIVASRLVDRFGKAVVMVSTPAGEIGRGSARSVQGLDITAALAANSDLLAGFGGHAMAAGFAIDPHRLPELRRGLIRSVQPAGIILKPPLVLDGYLPLREITSDLVQDLERLAPFGPGNPQVILACRDVRVAGYAAVGRSQEHLLVTVEDEWGDNHRVMWWQGADFLNEPHLPAGIFDLAYTMRLASFHSRTEVQLEWADSRIHPQVLGLSTSYPAVIIDYRQHPHPFPILQELSVKPGVQVWVEGEQLVWMKREMGVRLSKVLYNRMELGHNPVLVIWTTPPGPEELRSALELVQPVEIVLFANNPEEARLQSFLSRLAGLVKHVLVKTAGQASLIEIACAMAHREKTIHLGLEWLQEMGHIRILGLDGDEVDLASGVNPHKLEASPVAAQLKRLLDETAAYRDFFISSDSSLLGLDSV